MDIIKALQEIGLSENESKVYLTLLELDTAPVAQIATFSGLKRPNCYLILDDLVSKGIISKVPISGKLSYKALPPQRILELMKEKLSLTQTLLPFLTSLKSQDTLAPRMKVYEGKTGQRTLFSEMLQYLKQQSKPEIVWLSDWEGINKRRPGELARSFAIHSKKKVLKRELIQDTPAARELVSRYAYPNFSFRFIPKEQTIHVDLGITGNKVALFSLGSPLFAILIEHRAIAESFKTFFELAWIGAKNES